MERPAKRQKLSFPGLRPYPTNQAREDEELSCTRADAKTKGSGGRPITPTPTQNQYDLRLRHLFEGSSKNEENEPPPSHAGAPIIPRAPDTTVLATAIDVNVQDGNTTIANTLVLQATDATVVSFTSLGVLTLPADTTASGTITPSTTTYDSSRTNISSSSSSDTSSLTGSLTSSISPSLAILASYNSSAPFTSSDMTTTLTLTSTLNVSFLNGSVVMLPNSSGATASATLTSSASTTDSRTDHTGHSTVTSATPALLSSIPASATASVDNGSSALDGTNAAGYDSPTTAASSATSSSSSATGSGPGPTTPTVVGGVVGGVAGLAFFLLIMLALLRWYRKRLQARGQLPEQIAARSATERGPSTGNPMSSRSSHAPLASAILSSTRRWRPQSPNTMTTAVTDNSTAPDSERGFQRLAGRKIPPVIGTSSDQYGGNYGAFEKDLADGRLARAGLSSSKVEGTRKERRDLSESSFYRDNQGFYGGKGEPLPSSPTLVSSMGYTRGSAIDLANTDSIGEDSREGALEEYAVMRPSPARTPMTASPSNSSLRLPIQQGPVMEPGAPPIPALPAHLTGRQEDSVGRSLASQDGSRGSRFTESV